MKHTGSLKRIYNLKHTREKETTNQLKRTYNENEFLLEDTIMQIILYTEEQYFSKSQFFFKQ